MNGFKLVFVALVLFWVLIGFGVIHYGPAVGQGIENLFHGITARIDHTIGYPVEGGP